MRMLQTRFSGQRLVPLGLSLLLAASCSSGGGKSSGGDDGQGGGGGSGGKNGGSGGNKGGNGGATGGGTAGGSGGAAGGNPGGSGGVVEAPADANTCGPLGAAPVRRMNRWEYGATVRELFPKSLKQSDPTAWRYDDHQLAFKRATDTAASNIHLIGNMLPDPSRHGFENRTDNLNPSGLLLETYDDFAIQIAEQAMRDGADQFLPCTEKTLECGKKFIESFGKKAFRRPLTDEEKTRFNTLFEAELKDGGSFDAATLLTLQVFLQSPQFLYRIELGDPATAKGGAVHLTPYETASRLSYLLWFTMPDDKLFEAAEKNELRTPDQLEAQARRMIADPRFKFAGTEFFRQWGDFERVFAESYRLKPGFNQGQADHQVAIFYVLAVRAEAERFVEWLMTEGGASTKDLLTSRTTFANNYLTDLYSGKAPLMSVAPTTAVKGTVNATQRSGYLTRAHFNWVYSHFEGSVPPIRGHFIMERVLCDSLGLPPADALSQQTPAPAGPTTRQLFEAKVKARTDCPACHARLDGIGFTLENYNNFGGYRTTDNGGNVDASGKLIGTDVDGPVKDAVELSDKLGQSATVRQCMMRFWYEQAIGRDAQGALFKGREEDGVDACRLKALDEVLLKKNGDMREALVAHIRSGDFVWRPDVAAR